MNFGYDEIYRRRSQRRRVLASGAIGIGAGVGGTLLVLLLALGYKPAATSAPELAGSTPTSGPADTPAPSAPVGLGPCADLPGLPTTEVVETGLCGDQGVADTILVSATYDCIDGRQLHWNDWGWGYSDSDWQAHEREDGQLVPPDEEVDACLG